MLDIFKRLTQFNSYIISLGAVALSIALVVVWVFRAKLFKKAEGFESQADYFLDMYYADWCPHCVKAKPEFDALGSTQTIGGKKVLCQKFEYEVLQKKGGDAWNNLRANKDENPVSGFPTIRLYSSDGKQVSEYAGDRTKDGFLAFLKANVQ